MFSDQNGIKIEVSNWKTTGIIYKHLQTEIKQHTLNNPWIKGIKKYIEINENNI